MASSFCTRTASTSCTGEGADDGADDDRMSDDDSDCSDGESDPEDVVEMDTAERLAETILTGNPLTWDAGNDNKAAGTDAVGRYYVGHATGPMEILDEDEDSDWDTLPEGTKVVEAIYCNLVDKPDYALARWYTPSTLPPVKVPIEHLLHAGFKMERATADVPTG